MHDLPSRRVVPSASQHAYVYIRPALIGRFVVPVGSEMLLAPSLCRQALTSPNSAAQRGLAKKLKALFGCKSRAALAAQCIFTFTAGQHSRVILGQLVVPRIDGTMPFLAAAQAGCVLQALLCADGTYHGFLGLQSVKSVCTICMINISSPNGLHHVTAQYGAT